MIQLSEVPGNWKYTGYYRETRPYNHEMVFTDGKEELTETELLKRGIIYKYIQVGEFRQLPV